MMSSSPVPPELPELTPSRREALAACRDALASYSAHAGSFARVRAAIHALAAEARRHELSPEQMLIEVKAMLADAPALRELPAPQGDAERAKLVSVAIRAYFGERES